MKQLHEMTEPELVQTRIAVEELLNSKGWETIKFILDQNIRNVIREHVNEKDQPERVSNFNRGQIKSGEQMLSLPELTMNQIDYYIASLTSKASLGSATVKNATNISTGVNTGSDTTGQQKLFST